MGGWSELVPDLLAMISRRLDLLEDFTAFRGVCKWWRAAVSKDYFIKSWPTVPLLMLAGQKDSDDREFYSLHKAKIWSKFSIPEAKNKKCLESRGWLITVEGGGSREISLLHPFSRVQIRLPKQRTCCLNYHDYETLKSSPAHVSVTKAVLSATPSGKTSSDDYVLVIIDACGLGCWRPGDESWSSITASDPKAMQPFGGFAGISDVTYCSGKFYAITYTGNLWCWEVSTPPNTAYQPFLLGRELFPGVNSYIVELEGELLILVRNRGAEEHATGGVPRTTSFRVYLLDRAIKNGWREVTSLNGWSIFIGHNAAFSIDANSSSTRTSSSSGRGVIRPNCIYFTDDNYEAYLFLESGGGGDMGVYCLEDGNVDHCFADIRSFSVISPPQWISPSLS